MDHQLVANSLLGIPRFKTYLDAAGGDPVRGFELYQWAMQMSGALHAQLSFIEIAVRNSIDPLLGQWNAAQGSPFTSEWTKVQGAAPALYGILGKPLLTARRYATQEAQRRSTSHHRGNQTVTHDDVLAHLMFGTWVSLLKEKNGSTIQQKIWEESIHQAFPGVPNNPSSRRSIAKQLEILRRLRNRIAHHDNILSVDIAHRFNGMLSLLSKINSQYPTVATQKSHVRKLRSEDPRRTWANGV